MIGFDLQEVDRIQKPEKLLEKIALESEIAHVLHYKYDFAMHVATLWAVKEATLKALDLEKQDFNAKDVELLHKSNGRPYLKLYGKAKEKFDLIGGKIDISISHQKNIVGAVVLITKE